LLAHAGRTISQCCTISSAVEINSLVFGTELSQAILQCHCAPLLLYLGHAPMALYCGGGGWKVCYSTQRPNLPRVCHTELHSGLLVPGLPCLMSMRRYTAVTERCDSPSTFSIAKCCEHLYASRALIFGAKCDRHHPARTYVPPHFSVPRILCAFFLGYSVVGHYGAHWPGTPEYPFRFGASETPSLECNLLPRADRRDRKAVITAVFANVTSLQVHCVQSWAPNVSMHTLTNQGVGQLCSPCALSLAKYALVSPRYRPNTEFLRSVSVTNRRQLSIQLKHRPP
jgi:hypothetical protein